MSAVIGWAVLAIALGVAVYLMIALIKEGTQQ